MPSSHHVLPSKTLPHKVETPAWPAPEARVLWEEAAGRPWAYGDTVWDILSGMAETLHARTYRSQRGPVSPKLQSNLRVLNELLLSWIQRCPLQVETPLPSSFQTAIREHEEAFFFILNVPQVQTMLITWLTRMSSEVPSPSFQSFQKDFLFFVLRKDRGGEKYPLRGLASALVTSWLKGSPSDTDIASFLPSCPHPLLLRALSCTHPHLLTPTLLVGSGLFFVKYEGGGRAELRGTSSEYAWTSQDIMDFATTLERHTRSTNAPSLFSRFKLPLNWHCKKSSDLPFLHDRKGRILSLVHLRMALLGTSVTPKCLTRAVAWCFAIAYKDTTPDKSAEKLIEMHFAFVNAESLWKDELQKTLSPRSCTYLLKRLVQIKQKLDLMPLRDDFSHKKELLKTLERWRCRLEARHLEVSMGLTASSRTVKRRL